MSLRIYCIKHKDARREHVKEKYHQRISAIDLHSIKRKLAKIERS